MGEADRVKVCPSCPGLARQAVDDWWAGGPGRGSSLSGCENDGGGQGLDEYCHCDACVALDVLEPAERFGANLTDRYVFLWSRMLALARQRDPGAVVTGYAYADALNPPRVQRVPDGVVIDFVTRFNDDLDRTRAIFEGWRQQGARTILFRPNDLGCEIGLPMGLEERLFEHQALAIRYGAQGIDHDALAGFWSGISGLSYYVLSKQQVDPSQSFQHWEDEYAAAFGAASREIKAFYAYWRDEVFARRLQPADAAVRSRHGDGLLGWEICGAYARDNLYLALECAEPQLEILKEDITARDGSIWGNNAVEIFVDPTQSRADYYQFIVSSRGVLFDGRKAGGEPQDDTWNAEEHGGIEFAVAKGDSAWTLEVGLPFATLGLTSIRPGQALNFNLCRERILSDGTPRELSSQAALFGGFQTPSRFVALVLAAETA
jgi:hypothetical protein